LDLRRAEHQNYTHCSLNETKTHQVGDDDHTACPRSSARKKAFVKANARWDADFVFYKIGYTK